MWEAAKLHLFSMPCHEGWMHGLVGRSSVQVHACMHARRQGIRAVVSSAGKQGAARLSKEPAAARHACKPRGWVHATAQFGTVPVGDWIKEQCWWTAWLRSSTCMFVAGWHTTGRSNCGLVDRKTSLSCEGNTATGLSNTSEALTHI